jgi:hypothetical protein
LFGAGCGCLFGADGVGRAHARTGAAIYTTAAVDHVHIACRDSLDRAFVDAGTARGAQIGIDFVSHFLFVLLKQFRKDSARLTYLQIYRKISCNIPVFYYICNIGGNVYPGDEDVWM